MTRKGISLALAGALGLASVALTASGAGAFPISSQMQSTVEDLTQVRGGCGLGWHRGPWGGCRPNGAFYAYGYGPGVYGCWWRPTPWGPRRICAW
jgi:hypothetical protein